MIIESLDIIRCPIFKLKTMFQRLDSIFILRKMPTQQDSIDSANLTMDKVQKSITALI
jgi:hypothetical protein